MSKVCPKCSKAVYAAEWVRAVGVYFHKNCLKCQICNKTLVQHEALDRKGGIYCQHCFHKNFGTGFGVVGILPGVPVGQERPQAKFTSSPSSTDTIQTTPASQSQPSSSTPIHFECEYTEGCLPQVMERLIQSNLEQSFGYGVDDYCAIAADKIKKAIEKEDAAVHFVAGGTLSNLIVISSILKAHEGVLSADTGHIYVMETGAIEATGHKVLTFQATDTSGKITAEQIKAYAQNHKDATIKVHTVKPGMVYITHPTENGTLYSKNELESIYNVCREYNLPLYIDGARLAMGIASPESDATLVDIAKSCDIFLIGGAKCGCLFGEAIVIINKNLQTDFRYHIKQKGGLMSKGRLLGLQFDVLFTDNLYITSGKHAVDLALMIREAFRRKGYSFFCESSTNQQFPIIPNDKLIELQKKYSFNFWRVIDENRTAVRISTSWATPEENVNKLVKDIDAL